MIGFLLALVVMGLIFGALARLLVPGPDAMSLPATILLGIVGALVGGLIGEALFDGGSRFILPLLTTIGLLLLTRRTGIGRRNEI